MISMDQAEETFKIICSDIESDDCGIVSEEESKTKIITRVLVESLGWNYSDIRMEEKHDNGYSDYIIYSNGVPAFVLEAKRSGLLSIGTTEKEKVRYLKMSGAAMKDAVEGVEQAASYANPNGMSLAVLTDGYVWVIFKTFVPGENYKNKEALVFPSLAAVSLHFNKLYDCLSRQQFSKKVFQLVFDQIHQDRGFLEKELVSPIEDQSIKISPKSELAFDLERVFSRFFDKLTGDEELILECFVESRESKIAEFSLEKMTANVLGNISSDNRNIDEELSILIRSAVDVDSSASSGQTIFIVGSTGSGKTTFLERFFKRTLIKTVREQCIVLNVNSLDASGEENSVIPWLTEVLISKLEESLYEGGVPSWEDLQGLYHHEYVKRAKGVDSKLYEESKKQFKIKFGEKLEELVENDREGYLKRLLSDAVDNRKMLPVLIVDNTDEFSGDFKERVFQFFQSLKRHAKHCLVIFPVTDKSAWSFSRTDIFGIYESKSFFLPSPSPRDIFRKRIDFLRNKLFHMSGDEEKKQYLSSKGLKVSIENIEGFAQVLEKVFVDHDYTSKTIGELCNYNIRRTLLLAKRVITSSAIKVDELIKSYVTGQMISTDFSKFVDALIKGDYEIYKYGDGHEIFPIFRVDNRFKQSPLLNLRILSLLKRTQSNGLSIEDRHMSVSSIVSYFDAMGGVESSVDSALLQMLEAGLVEPYDVSSFKLSPDQRLSITHRGVAHLRLGSRNTVFFFQMALTTAISDEEVASQIASAYKTKEPFFTRVKIVKDLFLNYLIAEDEECLPNVPSVASYDNQRDLLSDLKKFSSRKLDANSELIQTMGEQYRIGPIENEIIAVVDWFDSKRHFGFAKIKELGESAFFHVDRLLEHGINHAGEGDNIFCDVARGEKGLYISEIHDVEVGEGEVERTECQIIRLYKDRKHGFVTVGNGNRQAYFHTHVFDSDVREGLKVGMVFQAEVVLDSQGYGYQVRRVIEDGS